jgi:predicted nucleotidyltransferase
VIRAGVLAPPPTPEEVARALTAVLARAPAAAVWLYGSVARGDARTSSDVDLAVLWAAHAGSDLARDRARLEREAAAAVAPFLVSVVDLGAAPVLLAHRVVRDGVLVCDADARRRGRFVARVLEHFAATRGARAALDAATLHRLAFVPERLAPGPEGRARARVRAGRVLPA